MKKADGQQERCLLDPDTDHWEWRPSGKPDQPSVIILRPGVCAHHEPPPCIQMKAGSLQPAMLSPFWSAGIVTMRFNTSRSEC